MKKGIWNKYYSKESKLLILKVDKKVNKPIKSWKWKKEKKVEWNIWVTFEINQQR